jgi:hypothetical protein
VDSEADHDSQKQSIKATIRNRTTTPMQRMILSAFLSQMISSERDSARNMSEQHKFHARCDKAAESMTVHDPKLLCTTRSGKVIHLSRFSQIDDIAHFDRI